MNNQVQELLKKFDNVTMKHSDSKRLNDCAFDILNYALTDEVNSDKVKRIIDAYMQRINANKAFTVRDICDDIKVEFNASTVKLIEVNAVLKLINAIVIRNNVVIVNHDNDVIKALLENYNFKQSEC